MFSAEPNLAACATVGHECGTGRGGQSVNGWIQGSGPLVNGGSTQRCENSGSLGSRTGGKEPGYIDPGGKRPTSLTPGGKQQREERGVGSSPQAFSSETPGRRTVRARGEPCSVCSGHLVMHPLRTQRGLAAWVGGASSAKVQLRTGQVTSCVLLLISAANGQLDSRQAQGSADHHCTFALGSEWGIHYKSRTSSGMSSDPEGWIVRRPSLRAVSDVKPRSQAGLALWTLHAVG